MLSLPNSTRVFLHREPVDFRKAHDGLCGVVRAGLGHDPLSGDLFVFLNRRRNRVKLLQWDGNGLWMHYKRLEKGTFRPLRSVAADGVTLSRAELSMLLDGIEFKKGEVTHRFASDLRIRERQRDDRDEEHYTHADGGQRSDGAPRGDRAAQPAGC